ncbi:MAG: ROK family protein [Bacillota bacterium]
MSRIAFDIGASHLRVGTILPEGIGNIRRIDTPSEAEAAVRALATLAREDGIVEVLFGGVPAIVQDDGSLAEATNLPHWNAYPFASKVAAALGAPVHVRNDAELAALGEAAYGAGKGLNRVAYIGLGTGVGTACIEGENVVPHTSNGAGREAVLRLADDTWLEDLIGGRAIMRSRGVEPKQLPPEVWSELTEYLVQGIENTARAWNPDVIILGGSLMNEDSGFSLSEIKKVLPESLDIRAAALKDAAGLYGAKAWAERESAA